jgi:ubiquinone biosynthesis protein UbiJ
MKQPPVVNVSSEVTRAIGPFKAQIFEHVVKRTSALETRVNKIKAFALKSTAHLQRYIDEKAQDDDLAQLGNSAPELKTNAKEAKPDLVDNSKPEWVEDVIKSFESRIEDLSTRLSRVTAETDEQAIRFAGLGFRSAREANAWLMIHMPAHHCGLIVDVHTVLEHIQVQSFGQDSIKTLESLIKLKIKTMADGLAMTSFEQKLPRFFKKGTTHKVIKNDASHFDTIASFDEWDAPGSGFRVQLKEELVTFRAAHLENIDNALDRDSIACAVATMALTESVAWIEGFIVFIDDYHRDLTKAKFGTKKAWHVATRLGKRILEEVAYPRNGVSNSFEAGNNEQVCQRILWAVLRAHDIMARYKRNGYKDDPTVSAELVKFMAVNTGFEALEVLAVKVQNMEADVVTSKKEAAAAKKAADSAANKTDELKKFCDLLVKRIAKLEK